MSFVLELTKVALADIDRHKKAGDWALLEKIDMLLRELREHPRTGTGKPEMLKNDLAGLYSRRISAKHRLVYRIDDQVVTVLVLSAYAHYGDR